jgi:hypothetical protein
MTVKVYNNLTGLNSLVPTLLVFRAYPYILDIDSLTPSIVKRVEVI